MIGSLPITPKGVKFPNPFGRNLARNNQAIPGRFPLVPGWVKDKLTQKPNLKSGRATRYFTPLGGLFERNR